MGNLENIGIGLMLAGVPVFIIGLIVLIVQAARKKKKKPALLVMLLSVIMFVGGFLLPISGYIVEEIPTRPAKMSEDDLESAVSADISLYCMGNYKDVKGVYSNVTSIKEDGDYYHVYGKVEINDLYNDHYYGNFDATYRFNDGDYLLQDLNIETPRKK